MKTIHHETLEARFPRGSEFQPVFDALRDFVVEARDHELLGINPRRLARQKKLDLMPTLKGLLHLTKAGIFDLTWSVHCPHCKGMAAQSASLIELKEDGHCLLCDKDFDASFDSNVELSFRVNPSVATVADFDEFTATLASFELEPGISVNLEPGEEHKLVLPLTAGNYAVVSMGGSQTVNLPVASGQSTSMLQEARLPFGGGEPWIRVVPLWEGEAKLVLQNHGTEPLEFLIAKMVSPDWTDAALVSSLQEFRDLFSEELLSPSESFSIRSLSFVFTDLKSSTEMYERLGDSKAFYLVKEHFKLMEQVVREFDGGIVKTIGDAVMAVFQNPAQALSAARTMIERFETYNAENHTENQIIVKVGVHSGPCIAVTLNDKLDYFGTSVNIAARVQGLSDGRTIMISHSVFREAKPEESSIWQWERFETSLKGLKDTYTVYKGALRT